jgi:isocitrate dehydrogenase
VLFSRPIVFKELQKNLKHWRDPIIVARHSHGDQYDSTD